MTIGSMATASEVQFCPELNGLQEPQRCYGLAAHACACDTADGVIVLDLKRERYLGIPREESDLLAEVVIGWPRGPRSVAPHFSNEADMGRRRAAVDSLMHAGLLDFGEPPTEAKGSTAVSLLGALSAVGDEITRDAHLRWRDVANFVSVYATSWWDMRFASLYSIADSIRSTRRGNPKGMLDVERAAEAVDLFRQLRPFFFAVDGKCLLHAITLVRFLARYGVIANWVIGVKTKPWAAHSWVQAGSYILDSNPEKVCSYTLIMVA